MIQKEIIEEFASARWKSSDDMRAFIKKVGAVNSEDVIAMLDFLVSKRSVNSPEHSMRVRAFAELAAGVTDKGLFEPYLRALKSDDKHIRAVLVNLFPSAVNAPLLPKLCELLRSPDSGLRRAVSQILQKIADSNVIRILSEMLKERNFQGRNEAMDIAGAVESPYSLELLKQVLITGISSEKVRAIRYLCNPVFLQGHQKSISAAVRPALSDTDEAVLAEAIALFSRVCTEEEYFDHAGDFLYHENFRLVKAAVQGLRHFETERTAAALERKLHTGPNEIRMAVLDTIEFIGSACVQKPLIKALEHRQDTVKTRAFEVLAKLTKAGKIEVSNAIIWLLRSDDPKVRNRAVEIAASIPGKTKGLWQEILDRLREEDWWVKHRLLDPLVEMAGTELIYPLLNCLSDPSELVRHFAMDALIKIKPREAFDTLIKTAYQDEEWWVREKAIQAIGETKDAGAIPLLLELAAKEAGFQVVILDALQKMGATSAAPQIKSFLMSENPDVRLAALKCLETFNDPAQGSSIVPLTQDMDMRVRHLAGSVLLKWNVSYTEQTAKGQATGDLSLLDKLLIHIHKSNGDDLILLSGNPPYMKRRGKTVPVSQTAMSPQQLQTIIKPILSAQQRADMLNLNDIDFSYEVRAEGLRFRANIFASRTGISAVFRIIKGNVWKLEEIGLPPVVGTFGDFKNGLVLVGGPTGSGKSTTLASIISSIVRTSRRHVISIEDPIEVVHKAELGLINQREVGVHSPSFDHALKMTLREDPDVILVGEMRDLPTIQFAVTAAETGHLVFGTVHTVSADSSVDRLINAYSPESQEQVRSMLADSLKAVLCQYLIRHKEKPEMVLASEIMVNNNAISNLIRKGKTFQIPSVIATSKEQQMQLMDSSLMELYKQGKISAEEAYLKARNKSDFEELAGIAKESSPAAGPGVSPQNNAQKEKPKWRA